MTQAPDAVQGHHEMPPYSDGSMRSAYHVRELEAYRLAQVRALCSAATLPKHATQTFEMWNACLSLGSQGAAGFEAGRLHRIKLARLRTAVWRLGF
jgi:hypothetical protein